MANEAQHILRFLQKAIYVLEEATGIKGQLVRTGSVSAPWEVRYWWGEGQDLILTATVGPRLKPGDFHCIDCGGVYNDQDDSPRCPACRGSDR